MKMIHNEKLNNNHWQ